MKTKEFIQKYNNNELKNKAKNGNYQVKDGKLVYIRPGRNAEAIEGGEVLAITIKDGTKLYNAAQLTNCGSYTRGTQAPAQAWMTELKLPMIPFNVFEEAELDITKARIIEQGKAETLHAPKQTWNKWTGTMEDVRTKFAIKSKKKPVPKKNEKTISLKKDKNDMWVHQYIDTSALEDRHFVGAMLIRVGNKSFLFDVDQIEKKHNNINAFLAQVKGNPKTIKQAYQSLKPKEVVEAEKKGKKVKRQGEWFLIPDENIMKNINEETLEEPMPEEYDLVEHFDNQKKLKRSSYYSEVLPKYQKQMLGRFKEYTKQREKYDKLLESEEYFPEGGELRAGNNRPNRVGTMAKVKGKTYVKGRMCHSGGEHKTINLNKWHLAIPNTATKSFTIEGNVD